jgi:hypothetical protein
MPDEVCKLHNMVQNPQKIHKKYSSKIASNRYFNRDLGWLSTVFNDVCVHLDTSKLERDAAFRTPERLKAYCEHLHANGEPSGI